MSWLSSLKRIWTGPILVLGLVITFSLSMSGQAYADASWHTSVKGPDVFGNTSVLAGTESNFSQSMLVIQCNSKDSLELAYLEPGTPSQMDELSKDSLPATLFLKVDNGPVEKYSAVVTDWNSRYLGVVVRGRTPALINAVRAIGKAKNAISIGVDIHGSRHSERFGAYKSTAAMDKVISGCKLDNADQ